MSTKRYQNTATLSSYTPPVTRRWYSFDWQFAVAATRLPLLKPAALIIAFMPVAQGVVELARQAAPNTSLTLPLSMTLNWWAAVLFLASWAILFTRCPRILYRYRHYGDYQSYQHSHRYILWMYHGGITQQLSWNKIVLESLLKGVAFKASSAENPDVYRVCPWEVRADPHGPTYVFGAPASDADTRVFYPCNIGRDLYIPLHFSGNRVIITLQEQDPQRPEKEMELFWILYSESAKERLRWRVVFWLVFAASAVLWGLSLLNNIKDYVA